MLWQVRTMFLMCSFDQCFVELDYISLTSQCFHNFSSWSEVKINTWSFWPQFLQPKWRIGSYPTPLVLWYIILYITANAQNKGWIWMDELFYYHLVAKRLSQSSRQPGSDRHFWREKLSVPKSLMFSAAFSALVFTHEYCTYRDRSQARITSRGRCCGECSICFILILQFFKMCDVHMGRIYSSSKRQVHKLKARRKRLTETKILFF